MNFDIGYMTTTCLKNAISSIIIIQNNIIVLSEAMFVDKRFSRINIGIHVLVLCSSENQTRLVQNLFIVIVFVQKCFVCPYIWISFEIPIQLYVLTFCGEANNFLRLKTEFMLASIHCLVKLRPVFLHLRNTFDSVPHKMLL